MEDEVFLNLVVQNILPSSIQQFMMSWLSQECKDFRIVFIDKNLSDEQKVALKYAQNFASVLWPYKPMAYAFKDENDVPKAKMTKILKDTSILPVDKMEVLRMRTEVGKQKKTDQITSEKREAMQEAKLETKQMHTPKKQEKPQTQKSFTLLARSPQKASSLAKEEIKEKKKHIETTIQKTPLAKDKEHVVCIKLQTNTTHKKSSAVKESMISSNVDDEVTVAMATQPCRINSYINVVYELLPQCTRICICFNGFDEIPKNLPKSRKIIAICANGKNGNPPDLGCDNKMYWVGNFPGYYATVDDDIIYPPNYIKTLKSFLKKHKNQIIVSFHGHIYGIVNGKIHLSNDKLICYDTNHQSVWCHRLGMGTAMFHPKTISITRNVFMNYPKNTGDDELMAIWAQKNKVPMLCAATKDVQIFSQLQVALKTGLCTNRQSMAKRKKMLESYTSWKLNTPYNQNLKNQIIMNVDDEVTVAMATQPHRKEQMLKVVKALLPQCTRMCIALNEYNEIPVELLSSNKIMPILTGKKQPIKDLGNLNKMLWCGMYSGYYATVDDDLDYFPGYIDKLKAALKKYNNKAICSFHGLKYDIKDGQIIPNTKSILFYNKIIQEDEVCLRPGMGTAMFNPRILKLNKAIYLRNEKGTSDDCLTSIWAQQHNIPCIVVGRDKIYMDATKYAFDGIYRNPNVQIARTKLMMSYTNWKYLKI